MLFLWNLENLRLVSLIIWVSIIWRHCFMFRQIPSELSSSHSNHSVQLFSKWLAAVSLSFLWYAQHPLSTAYSISSVQDIKQTFSIPARSVPMYNFSAKVCWRSAMIHIFRIATKLIHMYGDGLIVTYSLCYGRWEGSVNLWSLRKGLLVLQRDHSARYSQRPQRRKPARGK